MSSEIVTIHLGQAGVQISHALWELVCLEHGISVDGRQNLEASEFQDDEFGREFVFREASQNKFVPRALLVDLEPSVVDEIKTGVYRELWHPQQLITGKEDAASNFARGYYSQSRFEMDDVMERIRILVEQCENLSSFKLLYSTNGGTGSGLTSALCERLTDDYGKKYKFATTVYPSPGYSELMVEPYNALLHSSTNLTFCDCVVMMDNEAMLNVVEDTLRQNHNGFTIPNRMIATAVTTQFLSHRYRFVGQKHTHVNELLVNLIPYPRIHFPMMAFAPLLSPDCRRFEKCTPIDLARSVFEDSNQLLSVSALRRAYISCALLYRGPVNPIEAINAITALKGDRLNRAKFVDWCPTGFKLGVNFAPPVQAATTNTLHMTHTSLTMIAGNLAVRDVWTGIGRRFDQMYEKRAYVHWYVAEGMEEGEFALAREVIQQLVDDYEAIAKDAESAVLNSSTNYAQDEPNKPIIRTTPRVNRSPLNPNEMNFNQVTTLDDPNSLRTLENNEDAISLDTNQHHSNSAQADPYQITRLRLNDSDDTQADWRLTKAPPNTHARKTDAIPNVHPIRKRRLRFPEDTQKSTGPEDGYLSEHNQNNAPGLTFSARPGIVYGTNCSAAVTQQVRPRRVTWDPLEVEFSNRQNERLSTRNRHASRVARQFSNSQLTPVMEEPSSAHSYELMSPPQPTKNAFKKAEVIDQNYSSPRVQYYRSPQDGSNQLSLFDATSSVFSNQSQRPSCSSEPEAASLPMSGSHLSARIPRSFEVSQMCSTNRDTINSSPVSHISSSGTGQSFTNSPRSAQSWCAQGSSSHQQNFSPADSDISPPQITPLRSPLVLTQQSLTGLSQTNCSGSTSSQNQSDEPLASCPQLRQHHHTKRDKQHPSHQHHHHHHHHRHHHHHHPHHQHNHRHHAERHKCLRKNQDTTGTNDPADTKSRCQIEIGIENDEHICTSKDVSEITVRSSKSPVQDQNNLYPEYRSTHTHCQKNTIYTGTHHLTRKDVLSGSNSYTARNDKAEYSHNSMVEDRSYCSSTANQYRLTRESLPPSVECPLYTESSPKSRELQMNEVYSNTKSMHSSRGQSIKGTGFNHDYHQMERTISSATSKAQPELYRSQFLSENYI